MKSTEEKIEFLKEFVTPERFRRFQSVIQYRTRFLTVVLEDVYQTHNISAVLRTCDCFGIQDVHIVEYKNKYKINEEIALGADKWLTITHYRDSANPLKECIEILKKRGYRIAATLPADNSQAVETFPLDSPTALLFGTELNGLSKEAVEYADCCVHIPMYGFTESFNISVSAGICLHNLAYRLRNSATSWQLTEAEKQAIMLDWLCNSIRNSKSLIEMFEKK